MGRLKNVIYISSERSSLKLRLMDKGNPTAGTSAHSFHIWLGNKWIQRQTDLERLEGLHELIKLLRRQEVANKVFPFAHFCQGFCPLWKSTDKTVFKKNKKQTNSHFTLMRADYEAPTAASVAEACLTSSLLHFHLSEAMLPGACHLVHFFITVVLVLVVSDGLLPHLLHLCHRTLVLHDHVVHLLHLHTQWATHLLITDETAVQITLTQWMYLVAIFIRLVVLWVVSSGPLIVRSLLPVHEASPSYSRDLWAPELKQTSPPTFYIHSFIVGSADSVAKMTN